MKSEIRNPKSEISPPPARTTAVIHSAVSSTPSLPGVSVAEAGAGLAPRSKPPPRVRREYQRHALVASRQAREMIWFWARRCRKSTTLGDLAFDEMAGSPRRTVIAASASLLLGSEIVGMTLTATEQAGIVAAEATALRDVFAEGAHDRALKVTTANAETGKELAGLTPEDFAALYKASKLEMRLWHDRTAFSRLRIIAPNPATARGWGGTVLRDEAGYTPAALEADLRVATKPIFDTDPTFKLIYASNLSRDDRHPFFEDTLPAPDFNPPPDACGHLYTGQTGKLVHRVRLADAYAAGHVLFDNRGAPLTYYQFIADPANKLGKEINYTLEHQRGGLAVIDLLAMMTAQKRGATEGAFVLFQDESEMQHVEQVLRRYCRDGTIGVGLDQASTTGETSNPTSITVMERLGGEFFTRLILVFREKRPQIIRERLRRILHVLRDRPAGHVRRLCIDASNDRLAAQEHADNLRVLVPVELVINSASIQPPGYAEPVNYKTYLGDAYAAAFNDGKHSVPADAYIKKDHRLVVKDRGRYDATPDPDGAHADTFDSGKLAQHALEGISAAITHPEAIRLGGQASARPVFQPRRWKS
jgi:hypothetical protein